MISLCDICDDLRKNRCFSLYLDSDLTCYRDNIKWQNK